MTLSLKRALYYNMAVAFNGEKDLCAVAKELKDLCSLVVECGVFYLFCCFS